MMVRGVMINLLFLTLGFSAACLAEGSENEINLAGNWQLRLDPQNRGVKEKWYADTFSEHLHLPGSLQDQGFGNDPGPETPWTGDVRQDEWNKAKYAPYRTPDHFKWPFWLQPEKYYKGAAWYRKTVTIPKDWADKHIVLVLERPHWETRVWVDSQSVGTDDSLSTAHTYDLSGLLSPGTHELAIRVDNRMVVNVGPNAHSVSDHTQGNWNGIVGQIKLKATDRVWIDDVQIYPDVQHHLAKVKISIGNMGKSAEDCRLSLHVESPDGTMVPDVTASCQVGTESNQLKVVTVPLGSNIQTWDEFSPKLYTLRVNLATADGNRDVSETTFGMRNAGTKGTRITVNGHPVFMRGTLQCAAFPLTGYPPTDVAAWRKILKTCKAYGLNHLRFHSWCPPEAAFVAADELGFYYQIECASWANQGAPLGDGEPLDQWLYKEAERITKAYGNHPSFMMMAYGNEPGGKHFKEYLEKWCVYWRKKEPRMLHTSASGWPLVAESDFHNTPEPRIQAWGQGLHSIINSQPPQTLFDFRDFVEKHSDQPTISHEIGQWCVYPNFDEIKKYTGPLKAKNFEIFRDFLNEANMGDQAHDFLMASGKLQLLCYKADIEAALRTPGFGGFQLLGLHDFPGQGTALVGVLDTFWDPKPYVTAAEYHRFCAPIVPLARLPKRIFTSSDTLTAQIEVSQFGPTDLKNAVVNWTLLNTEGQTVKQGTLRKNELPAGDLDNVGNISVALANLPAPAEYKLQVSVENTDAINSWDVWVYPDTVQTASKRVRIAETLDADTVDYLENGGKVLLVIKPDTVKTDVQLGFSSIFWNTAWTGGQAPQTLGILCDPKDPALALFPTEYHSNWQWSEPVQHAATMELDHLPTALKPIVEIVPDWFSPKKLALVFEAKVGKGSLVVCSVDIVDDLQNRLEERELRASLLHYMEGDAFRPKVELTPEQIRSLVRPLPKIKQLGAKITASSAQSGCEATLIADGKPSTFWHSQYDPMRPLPQSVVLGFPKPVPLKGLTYLPRQDMSHGRVEEYAAYVSNDGKIWGKPVMHGKMAPGTDGKELKFGHEVKGRFVKFEILKGDGGYASIAELDIL